MFAQTSLLFTVWRKDKLCTPLKINRHEKLQYKSYTTVEYFSSLRVYNVFESGWQSGNTISLMPCWCLNSDVLMHVCSVKDHRWCQNVVRTHKVQPSVSLMFLQYFDGFCTNPWQHGIYLFYMIKERTNKKDRIQLIMKEHPLPDLDMLDQYSNMVTILLLCSLKKKSKRKSIHVLKTKTWKYMWGEILNRNQDMRSGK